MFIRFASAASGRLAAKHLVVAAGLLGSAAAAPAAGAVTIDFDKFLDGTGDVAPGNVTVAKLTLTQDGDKVDFTFKSLVGNIPAGLRSEDTGIGLLELSYDGETQLSARTKSHKVSHAPNPHLFGDFSKSLSLEDFTIGPKKIDGYGFDIALNLSEDDALRNGQSVHWSISDVDLDDFSALAKGKGAPTLGLVEVTDLERDHTADFIDSPPSVPEPASLALLGTGLLGLFALRRRRAVIDLGGR